jgi:UDP-glucose:(heptosyl)LPS alpha-1,3-glucosyltransferase
LKTVYKIAVIIPKYGLLGGAEAFVAQLTERLARNAKYDIHVLANKWLPNTDRVTFHKVPIITFPKFLTTISFAYFAGMKAARLGFDLIHTHDRIFEADLFTMHSVPHRFWVHEVRKKSMSLFDHGTAWVEGKIALNKRCRRFIAVSSLTQETFLQAYPFLQEEVQIIHPGVPIERFEDLDRTRCRKEIRALWDIEPSDVIILFVSMNFDIKGLDVLIAAVAKTKSNHPAEKIKILVVGKGNKKRYLKMAENFGIGNEVIFAGAQKEKLEQIYCACDIFSMLSKFDTFGITALEAMAASLPVIVSANVGAKDLVKQGINGFVIQDRINIDSISQKINLLMNKDIRIRMGESALETARNNTWETVLKKYEQIYEELLR